eukprot:68760-Karenia_brevis.AAC.1
MVGDAKFTYYQSRIFDGSPTVFTKDSVNDREIVANASRTHFERVVRPSIADVSNVDESNAPPPAIEFTSMEDIADP